MKKRCIVCGKKIGESDEKLCKTCNAFFEWKYKGNTGKVLAHFRKLKKRDREQLIKSGREKWKRKSYQFLV